MPKTHKVRAGEYISDIAQQYGLLPDTIWDDPANEALRAERKHYDLLVTDDVLVIPDKATKETSVPTGRLHVFRKKDPKGLVLRLQIDPSDASTRDDRFVLSSTDNTYRNEKTVKDDLVPGDAFLDLHYSGLDRNKQYTLEVIDSEGAEPVKIFKAVAYPELAGLSAGSQTENGEDEPYPEEDEPFPEEADEESQPG